MSLSGLEKSEKHRLWEESGNVRNPGVNIANLSRLILGVTSCIVGKWDWHHQQQQNDIVQWHMSPPPPEINNVLMRRKPPGIKILCRKNVRRTKESRRPWSGINLDIAKTTYTHLYLVRAFILLRFIINKNKRMSVHNRNLILLDWMLRRRSKKTIVVKASC